MSSSTQHIATQIKDAVIAALGQASWQALTEHQRLMIEECALDAAELQLTALAAAGDAVATAAIAREKAHITAQLASIAAAQTTQAAQAFWEAATQGLLKAAALLAA